jgi:serine/threonine protein kinase
LVGGRKAKDIPFTFLLIPTPSRNSFTAKDIAAGMDYLHTMNIIHRDLKPGNVLLTDQMRAKIADFGVSRESQGTSTKTGIGTPAYMAPEMILSR